MRKKILITMLAASLALGMLTGCGDTGVSGSENTQTESAAGTEDTSAGESSEAAATENSESAESSEEAASEFVIPDVNIEPYDVPDTEAFSFVRDMKIGWNLGNTFDSFRETPFANELDSETQWVGIATTQEMIDDLQEAGFNAIRVPVTWHPHVDENYQISEVWLNRV